ncbi:efflux RND transporter permease subunit [Candidatus Contendibacter odensensis]|uniref:Efflux pump membrane transporter n=1 Tax=Candidatus Contendobacter odensis Run_B_J11 TaxID=1400861 RepID=A0A7U7GC99_9GAMM|nr:multidrug efflux RND transporter permease subunit [Candidatus Contendobacter odensis]MBK8754031.1 multidrug efflux RND transporter permease subunit [Candidatus Competibacteraceae bacterium]CDH45507.1 multidrug efflux pump (RND family) [Candidatus Contendobacter odensis Run_B_J11]
MISHFFIDRPVFAAVISIILTLAGLSAMGVLPISQYPDITPVQVTVSATYPGASAEVVSQSVAAPIEQQVNSVNNLMYMYSSSSSTGDMTLNVFFDIGTDPNIAQVNVQNQVSLALPQLPEEVSKQGVKVQTKSSTFLMVIALYSPDGSQDETFVGNYTYLYVLNALQRIPGANQASIFGVPNYAMRIWLKPDRMSELGLTTDEVISAIQTQNQQFAIGQIGQSPTNGPVELTFPVSTQGRLTTPAEFENIILRASSTGAGVLRLKDVGYVTLGMQSYNLRSRFNGKVGTALAVYQQAGANALEVSKQVRETLEELKKSFPSGLDYSIALDTTKFVKASIDEVVKTLLEAIVLVILVVFIFLQSWRATVIPILAVIISVIATFSGMYLLGFSINMLTLFGMVLCIGIVVDDAIVVVENVERNMAEFHLSPKEAAHRAMEEVTGPVIAVVLVLGAVFVPVAFLGGMTGQLYKQFAITIAISVAISGLVALTLSPALAALLLKPGEHGDQRTDLLYRIFFGPFNRGFDWMTRGYAESVRFVTKRILLGLALFAVMLVAIFGLFNKVPSSFVPDEDQGYVFGVGIMPDGASLDRTEAAAAQMSDIFRANPAVGSVVAVNGYSLLDSQYKTTDTTLFVSFKDYEERKDPKESAPNVIREVMGKFAKIGEAIALVFNPPAIPGLGTTGGFEFWVQSRGAGDTKQLAQVTKDFVAKASQRPELRGLTSTINAASQQLFVTLDREQANTLGVPVNNVFGTLQALFGSMYVSQFNLYSQVWQVIVQAAPEFRSRPEDIKQVYVRSTNGGMVPLNAVTKVEFTSAPNLITRFNTFPSAKVTGGAAPGYSSGQALATMEAVAREVLPEGYSFGWSGQAYQEKKVGGDSAMVFIYGLIMVFLILAAQYEKWSLPFSVLMAVPFGIFGALLAVWLRGMENDVYFQIGLLTLVGLAAKNAILIVEFAVMKHEEGMPILEAAVEAARLRFRPILMTSLAFILGAIPLVIATGAGANSRHSIGTGIVGGMTAATVLAIFFVPMFFRLFEGLSEKSGGKAPHPNPPQEEPAALEAAPAAPAVPAEGGHRDA